GGRLRRPHPVAGGPGAGRKDRRRPRRPAVAARGTPAPPRPSHAGPPAHGGVQRLPAGPLSRPSAAGRNGAEDGGQRARHRRGQGPVCRESGREPGEEGRLTRSPQPGGWIMAEATPRPGISRLLLLGIVGALLVAVGVVAWHRWGRSPEGNPPH